MFEESRITDIHQNFEEERVEFTLRPQTLDEYIGQKTVTDNLKVFITATKLRGEPLDHVLFYGCLLYTSRHTGESCQGR